ncbi:HNH endonuclease [Streptomyces sp. NPDC059957]|uniref:HNH endonuclease n=1 Tax=unclassified Streptomyces TaxID=2593676 RepID=UPI003654A87D
MPADADHRVWSIRPYHAVTNRDWVGPWLDGGYCSLAHEDIPEIPAGTEREPAKSIVRRARPDADAGRVGGEIYRFVTEMAPGHVVVASKATIGIHVGVVAGDAYYDPTDGLELARRRRVLWTTVAEPLSSWDLPPSVGDVFGTMWHDLTRLGGEDADFFTEFAARRLRAVFDPAERYRRVCEARRGRETEWAERTVNEPVRDPEARRAVLDRSGGTCENPECGGMPADVTNDGEPILEVDHVKPLSEGGRDHPKNMIALCPNCHAMKTRGSRSGELRKRFKREAKRAHKSLLGSGPGAA